MLLAFPTIIWKSLDENNYADKSDQSKFEGKNILLPYCNIRKRKSINCFLNYNIVYLKYPLKR